MEAVCGFYGKLPSHGDFVRRGLTDAFVGCWDRWLQHGLGELRTQSFAAANAIGSSRPAWRFVLGSGLAGAEVWAGVWAPSVDRVGRQFPFCVAAGFPDTVSVFRCAALSHDWFDRLEQIMAGMLAEHSNDLDALHRSIGLETLHLPPARRLAGSADNRVPVADHQDAWQFELPIGAAIDLGMIDALEQLALREFRQLSLWWTDGSGGPGPMWRCQGGWPDAATFVGMLGSPDDPWEGDQLQDETLLPGVSRTDTQSHWIPNCLAVNQATQIENEELVITAAAWTDTGKVRTSNEDAHLLATDAGLWVVADGMGGHSHGELASRMVVESLSSCSSDEDLHKVVARVVQSLEEVNRSLREFAAAPVNGFESGTTVVVLLVDGMDAAVVWVGDSRLYRLRGGVLEPLTRDHSSEIEAQEGETVSVLDLLSSSTGELTRAVGGADVLEPEVGYFHLESGDRLLLCTDGLYTEVASAGLVAALALRSADAAATMLATHLHASEARDNATAVVVMIP